MKNKDLLRLKEAISLAIEIGKKADSEYPDDSGSCNLDSVAIKMKGVRQSAIDSAGLPGYLAPANSRHTRRLYLPNPSSGQANRRTETAEAMANSLKEQGFECYVHYQTD
ncbi:hypothetical protein [Pseudomonas bananamidigenes]|uniref:hypothetical protein n=1 Tax=Pseudomonas bananamidigenes TaxID=2843610 RepID=UPI001146F6A0|nr:hypothetical protein [Pseudomonas bananamidigenes]